jgi:hypothetical protein
MMTILFFALQEMLLQASQVSLRAASFRASILASGDRQELRQRWRLTLLVLVWDHSLREPFIGQSLAGNAINEAVKPCQGMILDVTFIESEGKLINVASKMLFTGMMIDANDAALENGENALNSMRGDIAANEFLSRMIDSFVVEIIHTNISACFIRMNDRTGFNILHDCILDGLHVCIGNRHGNGSATALTHAKNWSLPDSATAGLEFFTFVLVRLLAANECFVDFDDPHELGQIGTAASFPQAVQDEPSRFLSDPDFLGDLHAGNALARRYKQVHRVNPLVQGDVATLEDRASAHLPCTGCSGSNRPSGL